MYQQVVILGNLGADPEVRQLPSGVPVANFRVAVNEKWKDKQTGEAKERTEWFNVQAFSRLAEIAGEYLKKGQLVMVIGTLQTRKWQDKEGNDRYTTEMRAQTLKMIPTGERRTEAQTAAASSKPRTSKPVNAPEPYDQPPRNTQDFDDDIPY